MHLSAPLQVDNVSRRQVLKEHEVDQCGQGDVGHHGTDLLETGFPDDDLEAQVEAGEQGAQNEDYEYAVEAGHEAQGGEDLDVGASQHPFFVDGPGEQGHRDHDGKAHAYAQGCVPHRVHAVDGDLAREDAQTGDDQKHDQLVGDDHVFHVGDGHLKEKPKGDHCWNSRPGIPETEIYGERDKHACEGVLVGHGTYPLGGGVEKFLRGLLSVVRKPPARDVVKEIYRYIPKYGAGRNGDRACDYDLKYGCHG